MMSFSRCGCQGGKDGYAGVPCESVQLAWSKVELLDETAHADQRAWAYHPPAIQMVESTTKEA